MKNKNIFKNFSVFTVFYRYLFSKRANAVIKRVSLICFFGLTISVGSLLIVFNVMGGLGQSIKNKFLVDEPHVIISFKKTYSPSFIQKQKNKIKNILRSSGLDSGVTSFNFFENTEIIIRTETGQFLGAVARGYYPQYLKTFFSDTSETLVSPRGNIIDNIPSLKNKNIENSIAPTKIPHKTTQKQKNIIIGLGLASELNLYESEKIHLIPAENILLPPGEPIYFESVKIRSVVHIHNAIWNSNYIFYNQKDFPSFRKNSSYTSGFEIRLKDPEQFLSYKTVLKKEGFLVEVWSERNSSIFFALKLEKLIMSIFLSISGLITLLAVSSLLILLMIQKKQEIGILMAMGLSAKKTQNLFIGIGLLLCSLGVLGASIFSLSICLILKYIPLPFLSAFYLDNTFPIEFDQTFMLYLFTSIFCLAFITCVLSVRSQAYSSIAELLKTNKT